MGQLRDNLPTRTANEIVRNLRITPPPLVSLPQLPEPLYTPPKYNHISHGNRVGLAVESMQRHMTDEGWQIFAGLQHNGYTIWGHNFPGINHTTHVPTIINVGNPPVVVMQDKREWDVKEGDFREPRARFTEVDELKRFPHIFKVTILKDAHQRPAYHRQSAAEIGCHAWIVYYHPRIVHCLASYVRPHNLIRTYHSVDASIIPPFASVKRTDKALLSGAISGAYPLRTRLVNERDQLKRVSYHPHPGYHCRGSATPEFLQLLTKYKVAICTSSMYGYALRKIIEATACGCVVITDLPTDEVLPFIDRNLVRVRPDITTKEVNVLVNELIDSYDPVMQSELARVAQTWYDYREVGRRLSWDIEVMRSNYNG